MSGLASLAFAAACGSAAGLAARHNPPAGTSGCQGLLEFVRTQGVAGSPSSAYPQPTRLPADLKSCVDGSYEQDSEVRVLVAECFLRYDAELLDRHLLDADFSDNDLISVLWAHESKDHWQFRESCSTLAMREHIRTRPDRFPLTTEQRAMLEANRVTLAAVMAKCASGKE